MGMCQSVGAWNQSGRADVCANGDANVRALPSYDPDAHLLGQLCREGRRGDELRGGRLFPGTRDPDSHLDVEHGDAHADRHGDSPRPRDGLGE